MRRNIRSSFNQSVICFAFERLVVPPSRIVLFRVKREREEKDAQCFTSVFVIQLTELYSNIACLSVCRSRQRISQAIDQWRKEKCIVHQRLSVLCSRFFSSLLLPRFPLDICAEREERREKEENLRHRRRRRRVRRRRRDTDVSKLNEREREKKGDSCIENREENGRAVCIANIYCFFRLFF